MVVFMAEKTRTDEEEFSFFHFIELKDFYFILALLIWVKKAPAYF